MARFALGALVVSVLAAWPAGAMAETITFRMLTNQSRATFKADAPLETIVGTTAGPGVTGTLIVDPAKPQGAAGTIKVDLTTLTSGVEKRDADMKGPRYLDTANEVNRYAAFEIKAVDLNGPLEPGRESHGKVRGILTIKSKPVEITADSRVFYVKLGGRELEEQKRWGFTTDNIKVRAAFPTTLSDFGMQVPQILFFKLANEIQVEVDLTFVK